MEDTGTKSASCSEEYIHKPESETKAQACVLSGGGNNLKQATGNTRDVRNAPVSPLQRLTFEIKANIESLGGTIDDVRLETNATIVYDSMSASSRYFHSVQHVFDISGEKAHPVQCLAAYYHDTVYYQVDGGSLTAKQAEILDDVMMVVAASTSTSTSTSSLSSSSSSSSVASVVKIRDDIALEDDPILRMVLQVFGYTPGKTLDPQAGMNEFLSAVLAARTLQGCVSTPNLVKIVACIEATIPFRSDPGTLLRSRLAAANDTFDLRLDAEELDDAARMAIDLANRDVMAFANSYKIFLANTWDLMAEYNVFLRDTPSSDYPFTVQEFALAVSKMRKFLHFVQPENVFHRFGDFPPEEEYASLLHRAADNIEISRKYMDCKLLCASFLGALAVLTGGDCPVALFAFDRGDADRTTSCCPNAGIVPSMPELRVGDEKVEATINVKVWEILETSIGEEMVAFRISNTATASLLYGLIGDKGLERALKHAAVPMDEENARNLLDCLPRQAVSQLILATADSVITRRKALMKLAASYSPDPPAA